MAFYRNIVRLAAGCLFIVSAGAPAAQSGIFGIWKEPTGSSVEVFACGKDVCLRVASISAQAPTNKDQHNPNTGLRNRPLCGLEIGSGFHLVGSDVAEGGSLYDPKTGKTYAGSMTLVRTRAGDELRLRGYVGIKLFGETQTWVRSTTLTPCKQ